MPASIARADVAALADTCGASSSYDVDVGTRMLRFDRADPAPRRVEIGERSLRVDGQAIALEAAVRMHLVEFEQGVRALLPRVRRIAGDGVDLAVSALRAEAAALGLGATIVNGCVRLPARLRAVPVEDLPAVTYWAAWRPERHRALRPVLTLLG